MAMTWEVGDLAVCVDASPGREWAEYLNDWSYTRGLEEGRIYRVARAIPASDEPAFVMLDVGVPFPHEGDGVWPHTRFRKIRPDAHEACEEDFVTLLRRKTVRA
jgi:hypothetical protein